MGTITINVSNDVEHNFRETVRREIGGGKGKLGYAVEEALKRWIDEKRQHEISENLKEKIQKGLYSAGKEWKFKREELYDRQ